MSDKKYVTKPCTGNKLEELLNDMDAEGYDMLQVFFIGSTQSENRLMPGKTTVLPIYDVIFKYRERVIDA